MPGTDSAEQDSIEHKQTLVALAAMGRRVATAGEPIGEDESDKSTSSPPRMSLLAMEIMTSLDMSRKREAIKERL